MRPPINDGKYSFAMPITSRLTKLSLGLLCMAGLAACAGPSGSLPPVTAARGAAAEAPEYLLGPGDTLNVFVYRAPELSAKDKTNLPLSKIDPAKLPRYPR